MSAPFRAGSQGSVSGRLSETAAGGRGHRVPVSRCVSAAGVGFLVILFPPRDWAFLAVGLPVRPETDWTSTGFPCFARTSCDRGGCPLYSGDHGARPDRSRSPASARRITAARPCTPPRVASMRSSALRSITKGSRVFTRPIFPLPVAPGCNGSVLGFTPSFAPRPCGRRTSRWGQVIEHGPETTLYVIDLASNLACLLNACDLVSHSWNRQSASVPA